MKTKSIFFGLILLILTCLNTAMVTTPAVFNANELNVSSTMNPLERQPGYYVCYWSGDNIGYGSIIACDCMYCYDRHVDNPHFWDVCHWPPF
jgi:hypothetical protein